LGKNIARLRVHLELTQEQAAEAAKLTPRYFQSIEYGEKSPSVNSLALIREAFNCTWDELLKGFKSK
jgi:transcriptional regulator with XRE-family HTH domain